jgi:[acyl-carrier-protein] S-malonyltransferase
VVVPANFNSAAQIVVSGSVPAVQKAVERAKAAGAKRAMLLEVGGAFHSPLMESARAGLEEFLANVTINKPSKPVVANVTAEAVTEPDEIRSLLARQVTAPVKWAQTMAWLSQRKVSRLIEIGPGKVLASLARREMRPEQSVNLDNLEDIQALTAVKA